MKRMIGFCAGMLLAADPGPWAGQPSRGITVKGSDTMVILAWMSAGRDLRHGAASKPRERTYSE